MAGPTLGTIRGTIEIDYDGRGIIKAQKDVDSLGTRAQSSKKHLDRLASGLGIAGGLLAGGFAVAAGAAISFDKRMSAIQAVSGATAEELDGLRKKALQLGKDTKFSASESAQAMEELVKAGLTVDEVLNGAADATVALAAAGEIDLPQAATIASNAMNQFALSAQDLPKVADLIAGAANSSAIDVSEFGQSLAQVGAVAHLTGQSFDDTATAIALLGNAGIKGSDAGTSLKTFLSNLIPTTENATNTLLDLGIVTEDGGNKFLDAAGNYKSLSDIAGILNGSLQGLSESQKQAALQAVFGSDAVRAAAIIAEQGKTGFDELSTAMGKMTAADVAATRMDNLSGDIEQLKGSAETLAIQIGEFLVPALTSIVGAITPVVNWLSSLDSGTQKTIVSVGASIAAFALMGAAIIKIVFFLKQLQEAIAIMRAFALFAKLAAVATKIWTGLQWLLNIALNATPIGLIVVAILILIGVIVLLWKKNETFRKIVLAAWAAIQKGIAVIVRWFKEEVLPALIKVWNGIVDGAKPIWKGLKAVFAVVSTLIKKYISLYVKIWQTLWPAIKAVFDVIVAIVKTAFAIVSALFAVWMAVVMGIVVPAFLFIWNIIKTVFAGIMSVITTVVGFLSPYLSKAFSVIASVISVAWDTASKSAKTAWDFIMTVVNAAISFLTPIITFVFNLYKTIIVGAWNAIKTATSTVWNFIKTAIDTAVKAIVTIMGGIKAVVDKVRGFFNQLKEAADGGVGSLVKFVGGIPKRIISALGDLGKTLFNSGQKLIQGFIDGMSSMFDTMKQKLSDALGGMRDLMPFSPAKEGPFSGKGWTLFSGRALIEGFADGINGAAHLPVEAMLSAVAGVASGVDTSVRVATTATPSKSSANGAHTTTIGEVNLKGVWDFTDPGAARKIVGTLHDELDRYGKDYK